MEFNGGANNAYTTQDLTVYTNWFPASALEKIFDLESDRIANLSIDDKMVESERGVVLSERSTGLENSPWRMLSEAVNATAFQEHPYHWPVIGYEEDIKNWTKQDLEYYFKTYYAPNNCTVVISGAIKFDEVKRLAEKYMEPIPSQKPGPKVHLVEPKQTGERRIVIQKEVSTPYMIIGYHVPEAKHQDYYALNILSSILSNGNSSRLYKKLVDQEQLATMVFTSYGENFDPTLATDSLETLIYAELKNIAENGITEQELQKTKNQKLMEFYSQIATINGKSNNLGTYEVFFGDYKKMFDAPAAYSKVNLEDVKRVAATYFKKSNRTVGILKTNVED
jgi:zinc protease